MGMLAVEGTYDKMEALLNQDVKDVDGRTALDRATDETREFILGFAAKKA
jgi:hypothetical protein